MSKKSFGANPAEVAHIIHKSRKLTEQTKIILLTNDPKFRALTYEFLYDKDPELVNPVVEEMEEALSVTIKVLGDTDY